MTRLPAANENNLTSQFCGVSFNRQMQKFSARAQHQHLKGFGGYFDDEVEAGRAAQEVRERLVVKAERMRLWKLRGPWCSTAEAEAWLATVTPGWHEGREVFASVLSTFGEDGPPTRMEIYRWLKSRCEYEQSPRGPRFRFGLPDARRDV